jgi:hypothetical protein
MATPNTILRDLRNQGAYIETDWQHSCFLRYDNDTRYKKLLPNAYVEDLLERGQVVEVEPGRVVAKPVLPRNNSEARHD